MNKLPFVETVLETFGGHIIRSEVKAASSQDIEDANKTHLEGKCKHSIVYDTPGWMYDERTCFTCGKGLGLI